MTLPGLLEREPSQGYDLITTAGVAGSLAIIAATFPPLRRITGPEAARNE